MKKVKVIILLYIVLLNITIISLIVFNQKQSGKELIDKKEENMVTKNTFAIMVEGEDGYVESESNIWPSGMILNEELTNCVDVNDNEIEDALSYEDDMIIVETNKKIFCKVYFDKDLSIGRYLLQNPTTGLNTTLEGGLYRYQGATGTADNFVCFGTSDKDTCLNNTDAYMYRIIGIAEDGRIKLIKNEALNTAYYLHNTYSSNTTWSNSDLYKGLNGISGGKYSNLFIGNSSYMPSGWEDKIETTTWKYGDNTNVNVTADALYNTENGWANTTNAKIGLIYAYDYFYAYQSGGFNCSSSGAYSNCKTSWIHITNCDSGAPYTAEWTMSRYGQYSNGYYYAWNVYSGGSVDLNLLTVTLSVRPVFYLKSTVQFEDGTGAVNDPFIIS